MYRALRPVSSEVLEQRVALGENARAAVDDLVRKAVLVDVLDDALVVRTGLEPELRDAEGLGLLEQAAGDLCRESSMPC